MSDREIVNGLTLWTTGVGGQLVPIPAPPRVGTELVAAKEAEGEIARLKAENREANFNVVRLGRRVKELEARVELRRSLDDEARDRIRELEAEVQGLAAKLNEFALRLNAADTLADALESCGQIPSRTAYALTAPYRKASK